MKTMKRISALLLSLSLTFSLCAVSATGTQPTKCYDTLSDYTWNFSELSEVNNQYCYISDDDNGNSSITIDGENDNKTLKFSKSASTTKNLCGIFLMNGDVAPTTPLRISYSIKLDGAVPFAHYLRDFEKGGYEILKYANDGKLYFDGLQVCAYKTNTWYEVSETIFVADGYMKLKIREKTSDDSQVWEEYNLISDALKTDKTKTTRTQFTFMNNLSSASNVWIDDYYQNTVNDSSKPTLGGAYNDDFESEGSSYDTSPSNYRTQWLKQNYTDSTFENTALTGVNGKVATVTTTLTTSRAENESPLNPTMMKMVDFSKAKKFVHQFNFKLGGTFDAGLKCFGVRLRYDNANNDTTEQIVKIQNNTVALGTTQLKGFGQVESGKLYDCKVTYDVSNNTVYASITNADGKTFSEKITMKAAGLKGAFFCDSTRVSSTMYVDNFTWDIYNGEEQTVNAPTLDNGKVSCSVSGYRFEHESPMLLVAFYDNNGALSKVLTTSTFTDGKAEISLGSETYSTAKAYVWTNDLKPLREVTDFTASN